MYELTIDAKVANLKEVIGFLDEIMERHGIPRKARVELDIAVEEIFVNIASYGYPEEQGTAKIELSFLEDENSLLIRFEDHGLPYDPLKRPDPDITLPVSERPIGGLGILMVKKSMDGVTYAYENNCNILTIRKKLH